MRLICQPMQPLRISKRRETTSSSSSQQSTADEPLPRCIMVRTRWRGDVLSASTISTPVSTPSSSAEKISPRPYEPAHAGGQLENRADFTCEAAIDNKQIDDRQHQRRGEPDESNLERMQRGDPARVIVEKRL